MNYTKLLQVEKVNDKFETKILTEITNAMDYLEANQPPKRSTYSDKWQELKLDLEQLHKDVRNIKIQIDRVFSAVYHDEFREF